MGVGAAGQQRETAFRLPCPDLPGTGRTLASEALRSAENVLDTLLAFAREVTGGAPHLLIGHERWTLTPDHSPVYAGPTIIVAGRLNSTVGYAATIGLFDHYPHAWLAGVDVAGHALPMNNRSPARPPG